MKRLLFVCLLMLCLCGIASADEYLVDPAGNGDFATLTEAVAAAQDGDMLVLAGGTYDSSKETFPILVEKTVTILAKEGETPILASPRLVPAMQLIADGIHVSGLQIDFLRSGMWVQGNDIVVENCQFTLAEERWRTSSCGMWVAGAKRFTLNGCEFFGCSVALAGPPLSETSNQVPVLTGMFEVGEDIEFFTTHTMTNNLVNGQPIAYVVDQDNIDFSETCGQLIIVACDNSVFHDMECNLTSMGIQMFYSNNTVIEKCAADDAGIFGIYIAKSNDCVLRDSRADRGAHGIDLRAIHRCVVERCASAGSGQGIFLSVAYDTLTVDCDIVENGTGFYAAAGNHNHMDNCRVKGNELGIYIETEPNFTVTHTYFEANTNTGARTLRSPSFALLECTFVDNWLAAMAYESDAVFYYGNSFAGSEAASLYLKENTEVRVMYNTFTEADEALIIIEDYPDVLEYQN